MVATEEMLKSVLRCPPLLKEVNSAQYIPEPLSE
jgi:hypothetical protein